MPLDKVDIRMVTLRKMRLLALSLPESVEQDHHGRPSFRVGGRIFATLWDADHMNVMVDRNRIFAAVADNPGACQEFWWGKRLRAVQLTLSAASPQLVARLLEEAWRQKAPRRLINSSD
jgi:hypothetical protein